MVSFVRRHPTVARCRRRSRSNPCRSPSIRSRSATNSSMGFQASVPASTGTPPPRARFLHSRKMEQRKFRKRQRNKGGQARSEHGFASPATSQRRAGTGNIRTGFAVRRKMQTSASVWSRWNQSADDSKKVVPHDRKVCAKCHWYRAYVTQTNDSIPVHGFTDWSREAAGSRQRKLDAVHPNDLRSVTCRRGEYVLF
jgi:hypothetical protein